MKILYDHQMFSNQKFGGVTKYFTELIKNLPEGNEFYLPLVVSENQYLKENKAFFEKQNISLPSKQYFGKSYVKKIIFQLNERKSIRSIQRDQFDIFHPTFYNNYFLKTKLKSPFVITVHDLIEFQFEDQLFNRSSIKVQMENAIKRAERIIAISHNTKEDLTKFLNINPDKIDVIHHGFNTSIKIQNENQYGAYILYVGKRERYKNFITFAKAISPLLNKEKDLKLICIGKNFNKEEENLFAKLKISAQTIAMHVNERILNALYSHAKLFVFPSLYEGFGMPILESMANDCPVCLSNTSCFPEIAADAGEYFDPNNEESILYSIEKVFYDTDYRNLLIEKGRERLRNFSWSKTASETVRTYSKSI